MIFKMVLLRQKTNLDIRGNNGNASSISNNKKNVKDMMIYCSKSTTFQELCGTNMFDVVYLMILKTLVNLLFLGLFEIIGICNSLPEILRSEYLWLQRHFNEQKKGWFWEESSKDAIFKSNDREEQRFWRTTWHVELI